MKREVLFVRVSPEMRATLTRCQVVRISRIGKPLTLNAYLVLLLQEGVDREVGNGDEAIRPYLGIPSTANLDRALLKEITDE